jgi:hypothetical protein
MAFDNLTDSQRELVITLVEKLATGKFASESWALATMGRGWFIMLQGTGGAESEEIESFTETDLHALGAGGFLTLIPKEPGYALSLTAKAYSEYKQMQAESEPARVPVGEGEEAEPVAFDESQLKQIAVTSKELLVELRENYNLSRTQASAWFHGTLGVSIFGFVLLVAGIVLVLTDLLASGVVNTIAGIITEFVAFVFFRQATSANKRQDTYHRDLIGRQKTLDAVQLAQLITEQRDRNRVIEIIIQDLLGIHKEPADNQQQETAPSLPSVEQHLTTNEEESPV